MQPRCLGDTGLRVSRLGFGTLPMGPLQADMPLEEGVSLLIEAVRSGINFVDSAHSYGTYKYVGPALEELGDAEVVVATKSPAEDSDTMAEHVEHALRELGRDTMEIFHLHAARAEKPFESRRGALDRLVGLKEEGVISCIGVATHCVGVVREAAERDEVDVVFPIVNVTGMGIIDGSASDMLSAIELAAQKGKGIYAMKALAGGNLIDRVPEAFEYVTSRDCIHSVSVGMVSIEELKYNVALFTGETSPEELEAVESERKSLIVLPLCRKCGTCIDECPNDALEMGEDRVMVDAGKCILCGYCAGVCPEFCIRVV